MGYGSYKASDWQRLKNSKGIRTDSSAAEIFSGNEFLEKYDPKYIDIRESRDSVDSPESTPIILGFDVTGSMGYLAAEIAKNSLNKTITQIYDKQPVTNPHVMCAAFTSPRLINEPASGALQVTQFEADIRVVEQLLEFKVMFGGNRYSFDDLVWYFASHHTDIDCFSKRRKKGFIFCIGDEVCGIDDGSFLTGDDVKRIFGDEGVRDHIKLKDSYDLASERYEIFHIVTDMGYRFDKAYQSWERLMPGRVASIREEDIQYLSEVIISILLMYKGYGKDDVIRQWQGDTRDVVSKAISDIKIR